MNLIGGLRANGKQCPHASNIIIKYHTVRGNLWFHQYEQIGGDAIDFVRRFYDKSYPEAVEFLLSGCDGTLSTSPPVVKEKKPFQLPLKNDNIRRVYAYLIKHRGLDSGVLHTFVKSGMIYESADYHNAVFVGYDVDGVPRHAHMRGTGQASTFKGNIDSCIPDYSFHWNGASNKLYLFEAPIDMLSFISMNQNVWKKHSYAACCGISDRVMWQMMADNPQIDIVYLCLDNDEAGQKASKRISESLFVKGIKHEILVPIRKDWNEDLLYPTEKESEEEGEKPCQALQL